MRRRRAPIIAKSLSTPARRPDDFYREVGASGGGALSADLPGGGRAILRGGVDHLTTPETAGRAQQAAFTAPFAGAEAALPVGAKWRFGAQLAWKSRPPTLRELYGVALGRFLPNPDLKAETALYGEASAGYVSGDFEATAIGFLRDVDDTLEQRSVIVAGRSLRQRINLDGSRSFGAVLVARWTLADWLALSGDAMILRKRLKGVSALARLTERPSHVARARIEWTKGRFAAHAEAERFGGVWSIGPDGALVALDAGTFVSFRASANLSDSAELYLRVDNAFDAFYAPQAGLPADGRRIGVGIRVGA